METPKSAKKMYPARNPTPKLSKRKKGLFVVDERKEAGNDVLDGIKLLESLTSCEGNGHIMTKSTPSIGSLSDPNTDESTISFHNDVSQMCATPLRRSPRTKTYLNISQTCQVNSLTGKENTLKTKDLYECTDENLHNIFNVSMRIGSNNQSAKSCEAKQIQPQKRKSNIEGNTELSALKKTRTSNAGEISAISTKNFYPRSIKEKCLKSDLVDTSSAPSGDANISPKNNVRINRRVSGRVNINRGVKHKIRRPTRTMNVSGSRNMRYRSSMEIDLILKNVRNEKLKNIIEAKRKKSQNIAKVHDIFRRCPNPIEMARPLTVISRLDDSNNNLSEKNFTAGITHSVLDEAERDFSEIESSSDEIEEIYNTEEIIPLISHQTASKEMANAENEFETVNKKKFFKTGLSQHIPKEVHITDNIKASVCNGRLSLIQEEKKIKKKPKRRSSTTYDMTDEQATVETILKNLDDTTYGDILQDSQQKIILSKGNNSVESSAIRSDLNYLHFRSRLPYNTTDISVIEQQHLLLDFLINNNMCTEENFTIFIADPDNHKEEAARIVDQVFVLVNEQDYFRHRIPCNTTDPEVESQQNQMLDFLIENNICTEENFDIFITQYNQRYKEADDIMAALRAHNSTTPNSRSIMCASVENKNINSINTTMSTENIQLVQSKVEFDELSNDKLQKPLESHDAISATNRSLFPIFQTRRWKPLQQQSKRKIPRTWNKGQGANQYQIDAGQKNFGAHQCKQCGLVYSIHEPEEEKLHRDYHTSLCLLRFKGWIDEDIVAIYPEWGPDGRILRITEASHPRRHERLADILTIVDKELGFSSQYIIPQIFVAYLAVRKFQVVGFCLVIPLDKANKYVRVDGVDCLTEKEYPAKCGISRIWVAPLHRRLHIASKLIYAVQQNTIFGEEIPVDKIAFSAPTENGRMFAQKVTQLEDFLVYQ